MPIDELIRTLQAAIVEHPVETKIAIAIVGSAVLAVPLAYISYRLDRQRAENSQVPFDCDEGSRYADGLQAHIKYIEQIAERHYQ